MTTFGYQLTREVRKLFAGSAPGKGRELYLAEFAVRAEPRRLCLVMEKKVGGLEQRDRKEAEAPGAPTTAWEGFPWLTLVFGSGCLEVSDELRLEPQAVARAIRVALRDLLTNDELSMPGIGELAEEAASFAVELVKDRRHADPAPRGDEHLGAPGVDRLASRTTLLAALLTRFYFYVKGGLGAPLSRWDDDRAELTDAGRALGLASIIEELRDAAKKHIKSLEETLSEKGSPVTNATVRGWISALFGDLRGGLKDDVPHLSRTDLHLLTELTWYLLTRGTAIYPGWTDLLLDLTLSEQRVDHGDRLRTRPRFYDLKRIPELVDHLYEEPTKQSWVELERAYATLPPGADDRPGGALDDRDRLYRAGARVLWAQAAAIAGERNSRCPPASAFVTSFDIELEMSLWLHAVREPGILGTHGNPPSFSVVLPVHVIRKKGDRTAALCWLRGKIRPDPSLAGDEALEAIRHPTGWRLLTPDDEARSLLDGPNVVHFSGGPMFDLPDKGDTATMAALFDRLTRLGVELEPDHLETMEVQHAVTVDEYLAFRQSEAELIWSSIREQSRGLHPFLLGSSAVAGGEGRNRRFWMALGVPMADSAIRHRVVTQITLHDLKMMATSGAGGASGGPAPAQGGSRRRRLGDDTSAAARDGGPGAGAAPGPRGAGAKGAADRPEPTDSILEGVVVNRRIDDDEASLLYWVGFDVVCDTAVSFIRDLDHYVSHLTEKELRRPDHLSCPLPEDWS